MVSTYRGTQIEKVLAMLAGLTDNALIPDIVVWNEANRDIAKGTSPVYGPYTRDTAPHMAEVLRRLSPDDPCTDISILKSVQSTATFHAEMAMAFWIEHMLGSMGYFTASMDLGKVRSSANIDVMIDDSGLAHRVKPHSTRNIRKKADSTFYKEFQGGIKLIISSYGSIAGMKSNTIPLVIMDEIDEAKDELGNQGDILAIIEGRTLAVRDFKILALSTPTTLADSKIYRLFLRGDQRYYYVPCPCCGEKQVLVLREKKEYGLTYDLKPGDNLIVEPGSVRYICKFCKDSFRESKKQWCLSNGVWIPKNPDADPLKKSYHISGLMSPEQMLSWTRICSKHATTNQGKNILLYKDFTINIKGWPWSRVEKKADGHKFRERNLRNYRMGEVPDGGFMLLGGVDIHKDRAELAVLAVGKDFVRWLVDYKVFFGDMSNSRDPVWRSLVGFINNKTYTMFGREIMILKCAVDCGYDPKEHRNKDWNDKSHIVYNFVGLNSRKLIPVRGSGVMKNWDVIKEARTANPLCPKVYMLNSSLLKDLLSKELILDDELPPVNFPSFMSDGRPLNEELIAQFLSERYQEIDPGVMGWKKVRERNEVLDTWLYATAVGYFHGVDSWTPAMWDSYVERLKAA